MAKRVRAIRPSAAVRDKYQRRLLALIDEMTTSARYWTRADYRAEMGMDASPARALRDAMRKLSTRWSRKFDDLAEKMARDFGRDAESYSNKAFAAALRDAGFTVRFKPTRAMNESLQAVIGENVALIKSIPEQYFKNIEGAVMRSASVGGDLSQLTDYLENQAGVTRRRAEFIARDQNNKATAVYTRTRQLELGITKARWRHSAGGKHPRESHVAFSGKTYDVTKGAFIDGEWIYPGQLPNCRCVAESVIEGFE